MNAARRRINTVRALQWSDACFGLADAITRFDEVTGAEVFKAEVTLQLAGGAELPPDAVLDLLRQLGRHLQRYAERLAAQP